MQRSALARRLTTVLAIAVAAMPASVSGHGGVVEEDDLCVIKIGYLRAHFKIYVPQERGHKQFCEDIPVRGEGVFVMEYEHDGLNEAEIDFRIIRNVTGKGTFARIDDVNAIEDIDAVTVAYQPPAVVPGVYTLLQDFPDDGEFIGIVSARQVDTDRIYTAVFPFEVGYTGVGYWPWIVGGLVLLQLNYWYLGRRRSQPGAAAAALLLLALASGTEADDAAWGSSSGVFVLHYDAQIDPLEINRMHAWVLRIEDRDGNPVDDASITIEGGMPEHDHGLPTAPRVTASLGDGKYLVEGMRFHMRGYWELTISIDDGSRRDRVTVELTL